VILLTLLAGALIGAWQGFWIAWMEVPAFIVTLASLLAFRGAALTVTGELPHRITERALERYIAAHLPGRKAAAS